MNIKKFLSGVTIGLAGFAIAAAPALAATIVSLSPANVNVTAGQSFSTVISVNPQGVANYTVKMELKYPSDLLEVKSFSFGDGWMPIAQSGYDLVDNANGVLIKTAGYAGGLSSSAKFGTVSFVAKKSGSGTIATGGASMALDANNANVISGTAQVAVTVAGIQASVAPTPKPSIKPTPASSPKPTVKPAASAEPTPAPEPQEEENVVASAEPSPTEQPGQNQESNQPENKSVLLASISSIVTLGTGKSWVAILLLLAVGAVVYYFNRKERKKKQR